MKEIWNEAFLIYNLPLTLILGCMTLFWVASLCGLGDLDSDVDLNLEGDVDGDLHGSDGVFGFIMRAVNAQDIPVMLVLSLLSLFMWIIAIASNFYLNTSQSGLIASGLFIGNFILSVILVKLVTQPLRPMFRSIKNDKEHQEPLVGSSGIVKSRLVDADFGQCEVIRPKGAPALLNCRLAEGERSLARGEEILVIGQDPETQKFIIKSLKN